MKDFLKFMFGILRAMLYSFLIIIGIMGSITIFYSVNDSSCVLAITVIVSFIAVMYGAKNLIRVLEETNRLGEE